MNRRRAIIAIGLGISFPGCLDFRHHGGVVASPPDGVEDVTFERLEQEEVTVDPGTDPKLTVDWDEHTFTIEGYVYVGSGECNQAVLESVDVTESEVQFEITPGKSPDHPDYSLVNFACTMEMAPDPYRVEGSIPTNTDRVVVVERDAMDEMRSVSEYK